MLDRFRLTYRLQFENGAVTVTHGEPPRAFVSAVIDIAHLHNIRRGRLECKGQGRHARLRFSNDFPERGRQAIRNVWNPPTTPGPGGSSRITG